MDIWLFEPLHTKEIRKKLCYTDIAVYGYTDFFKWLKAVAILKIRQIFE